MNPAVERILLRNNERCYDHPPRRAYLSTSDSTAEEMAVQSLVYLTVLIHSFEIYQYHTESIHCGCTFMSASGYPQVFWMKGTFVESLLSWESNLVT